MASLILSTRRASHNKTQVVASRITTPAPQPGNCPGAQCVITTLADVKSAAQRVLDRIDQATAATTAEAAHD